MSSINVFSFDRIVNSEILEFRALMQERSLEVVRVCRKIRLQERNRLATQRLRQGKVDLKVELERKLSVKVEEWGQILETERQVIETRDRMRREQDQLIEQILCKDGLDKEVYTMLREFSTSPGRYTHQLPRRVLEPVPVFRTWGHGLREDFFREGDVPEWAELSEQYDKQ